VLDRDGGPDGSLMCSALLIGRNASKFYPAIITIPRCMINDMPAPQTGHPRLDSFPGLQPLVLTNEGTKEWVMRWHAVLLGNTPLVTKLSKSQWASSIRGPRVGGQSTSDGQQGGVNERRREGLGEFVAVTNTEGCVP